MMKKILMGVFLTLAVLMSASAAAAPYNNGNVATTVQSNFDKLSAEDKQKMLAELSASDNAAKAADIAKNVTPEDVERWANVGRSVGVAIGEMFKSLGMGLVGTVDQFSGTTVGKVAIGVLLWKLFSNQIEHYLLAASVLFIFLPMWWVSLRRNCMEYTLKEDSMFGRKYVSKMWSNKGDDSANATHIVALIALGITFVVSVMSAS